METVNRKRSLVGPVILIGLGVVFLLNNLGFLGWGVWESILRLWPVLLIAIGLEVLLGRGSAWGSLVIVLVVVAIAGVIVMMSNFAWPGHEPWAFGEVLIGEQVTESLGAAKKAEVEIKAGVGSLRIGSSTDPANLIEGRVARARHEQVNRDYHVTGDTAYLTLESHGVNVFPGNDRFGDQGWDLKLNNKVPLKLKIGTGIGVAEIDLAELQVTEVEAKNGVGKTTLTLPGTGRVKVRVEGGIGEITIFIPRGMAARIQAEKGLGEVRISDRYQNLNGFYVSPDYETATNQADIEVKGGIGQIRIEESTW